MKKRPTIDDVAIKAGVSRQTVSRAINNLTGISETTRDHVLDVVAELGYRPSRLAQGMAGARSYTIGLVMTDITNPAHANIARGLQDVAETENYNVFFRNCDADAQNELEALRSFVAENVDGIVIVGGRLDQEVILAYAEGGLPLVMVHRRLAGPYLTSILADVERATHIGLEYLFGAGHEAIGLITRRGDPDKIDHVQGYLQAYRARGLSAQPGWIFQDRANLAGGYAGAKRLLTNFADITALVAFNDLMAIGALRACAELGRQVPDAVAVLGFDDIALASYVTPSLSTIRFNGYEVGRVAMQRLLEMINEPAIVFPPTILDIELVIRESTSKF